MAQTTPSDVLRRAAEIVAVSWADGPGNAKDASGRTVPLFHGTGDDTGRATLNPEAVSFSIYGAIVKATGELRIGLPHVAWEVLLEIVRSRGHRGAVNTYNAAEGVTADDCRALLIDAATRLDKLLTTQEA